MHATNYTHSRTAVSKTKPSMTMQNTGMLTLAEFKGMKERIQTGSLTEDQERKMRERKDLKDKSDARVTHWPNTIQAVRKKKDEVRFERFQKEEEERRRIDLEEAKYQAAVKQDILGKANKQIFETNDRVKSFQSALLLADAIKEREAQVEINKRKKEITQMVEERYVEIEKENMKEFDEREEEKRKKEEQLRREQQIVLKDQHDQFKAKYIKRMQEEKIEGEIVKIKAKEDLLKQKEEEKQKRNKLLAAQEDTRKANDLLNELKYQEKLKDLEKEKEIEAFAKKKEEIMEMRKMREDLKFKEKQAARQKIIDTQVEQLRQMKNKEDEIISKQIKEAEIKAEENERIKKEKRDQLVSEIDKQINLTLEKRKVEKERQKVDDKNFQEFWKSKNKELESKETADKLAYAERCRALEEYHKKQANQKQQKLEQDIMKEFEDANRMKAAIEEEDKVFNSYAQKCVMEWDDNGKNVKPLLLELQKYKKKAH